MTNVVPRRKCLVAEYYIWQLVLPTFFESHSLNTTCHGSHCQCKCRWPMTLVYSYNITRRCWMSRCSKCKMIICHIFKKFTTDDKQQLRARQPACQVNDTPACRGPLYLRPPVHFGCRRGRLGRGPQAGRGRGLLRRQQCRRTTAGSGGGAGWMCWHRRNSPEAQSLLSRHQRGLGKDN